MSSLRKTRAGWGLELAPHIPIQHWGIEPQPTPAADREASVFIYIGCFLYANERAWLKYNKKEGWKWGRVRRGGRVRHGGAYEVGACSVQIVTERDSALNYPRGFLNCLGPLQYATRPATTLNFCLNPRYSDLTNRREGIMTSTESYRNDRTYHSDKFQDAARTRSWRIFDSKFF